MKAFAAFLGILFLIGLYMWVCGKISDVNPRLGRVLSTPLVAAFYALIGTVMLTVFIGAHRAIYFFPLLYIPSLRKAWIDCRPETNSIR